MLALWIHLVSSRAQQRCSRVASREDLPQDLLILRTVRGRILSSRDWVRGPNPLFLMVSALSGSTPWSFSRTAP
eukprot:6143899-Pyramimonas_sp.AAC.1